MAGHKTTYTQLERFHLIDNILADGEIVPFETILEILRHELRDELLSESSLRRDIRYMKNELGAPLAYDKKKIMAGIIQNLINYQVKVLAKMSFCICN